MTDKSKYPEILTKPMSSQGLMQTDEEYKGIYMIEYLKRLKALYEHYGFSLNNPDDSFLLVSVLASEYIKGFQVENGKKPGAPQKWKGMLGVEFYFMVNAKKEEKDCSIKEAIGHVSKNLNIDKSTNSLNVRYYEMEKDPMVVYLKKILTTLKEEKNIKESIYEIYKTSSYSLFEAEYKKLKK